VRRTRKIERDSMVVVVNAMVGKSWWCARPRREPRYLVRVFGMFRLDWVNTLPFILLCGLDSLIRVVGDNKARPLEGCDICKWYRVCKHLLSEDIY
jgi:hypothetical protein